MSEQFNKGFEYAEEVFLKMKNGLIDRVEVPEGQEPGFYNGLAEGRITYQYEYGIKVSWTGKKVGQIILTLEK